MRLFSGFGGPVSGGRRMGVGRLRDQEFKHVDCSFSTNKIKINISLEFLLFQTSFQCGLIQGCLDKECVYDHNYPLSGPCVCACFQQGNLDSPSVCQLFGGLSEEGSAFVFVLLIWTVSAYVTAEHPLSTMKRDWM